ncbi:hypothetical protein KSP40_PGU010808 [Platanthera guangdongensis]|uniref:SOSEKI DIX-like domain-containing protein n=1 Tax=Platanthera guangdongensis TaxID=2320717 RepID=A0ABR2LPQ1_9ASPA
MEGRMRINAAQLSPDRYMVWREPSGNRRMPPQEGSAVPVVIYKKRFVWQDLAEDDLILPAHGSDYILKGSLILDQIPAGEHQTSGDSLPGGRSQSSRGLRAGIPRSVALLGAGTLQLIPGAHLVGGLSQSSFVDLTQRSRWVFLLEPARARLFNIGFNVSLIRSSNNPVFQKNLGLPQKDHFLYSRKHEASSSSSPVTTTREMKPLSPSLPSFPHPLGDDIPCPSHQSSITPIGAPDSSSHTENVGEKKTPSSQTTIDSTNNGFSQAIKEKTSQTPVLWNTGMDTLISLVRAEVSDSFRGTEEKRFSRSKEKMKTNALLQLITCRLFVEKINIF